MFIKLTLTPQGRAVVVNINHIVTIQDVPKTNFSTSPLDNIPEHTHIATAVGGMGVMETTDQILAMIKESS